tara:strand:- start:453 stop:809 length:357 start_codon:yes stop_codon:yes gene_type:complete
MENEFASCAKCAGTGHIMAFNHIHNGSCFQCNGTGQFKFPTQNDVRGAQRCDYKTIQTVVGKFTIHRFGDGFKANHVHGCVWFNVSNSQISNFEISDNLLRYVSFGQALQAFSNALKR